MSITLESNKKNDRISAISEIVDKHLSVDEKAGLITEDESHAAFYEAAPEGIDQKSVKLHEDYASEYIAGAGLAISNRAVAMFNKNKDLQETNATIGYMGKRSELKFNNKRQVEYRNPADNSTVTKHNVMKVQATTISAKGPTKSIRDLISEQSKDLLK